MQGTVYMQELRSSVRFPIRLPVSVTCEEIEHAAETQDISAGGVLFRMDSAINVGSTISFSIAMPASVLGTPMDVHVNCVGRVVRCTPLDGYNAVAAVIDEYDIKRL
jgi:hypothetical protein